MKRYSNTFFRFWWLALLPILALPAAETYVVRHVSRTVLVNANLYVSASPSSNQYISPAQAEANVLSTWLYSPGFAAEVAALSPTYVASLTKSGDPNLDYYNDISTHVTMSPRGDNLLVIGYTSTDVAAGTELINNILSTLKTRQTQFTQQRATSTLQFLNDQLRIARQHRARSQQQLYDYLARQNISPDQLQAQLPHDATLADLYDQAQADQNQVNTAQQNVVTYASQDTGPAAAASINNYSILDGVSYAGDVSSPRRKQLTSIGVALAIGLLIAAAIIVIITGLDRSLRFPDETMLLTGLPVLAILPYNKDLAAVGKMQRARAAPKKSTQVQPAAAQGSSVN